MDEELEGRAGRNFLRQPWRPTIGIAAWQIGREDASDEAVDAKIIPAARVRTTIVDHRRIHAHVSSEVVAEGERLTGGENTGRVRSARRSLFQSLRRNDANVSMMHNLAVAWSKFHGLHPDV